MAATDARTQPPITVAELENVGVVFLLVERTTCFSSKDGKSLGKWTEYELYPGPLRNLEEIFDEIFSAPRT